MREVNIMNVRKYVLRVSAVITVFLLGVLGSFLLLRWHEPDITHKNAQSAPAKSFVSEKSVVVPGLPIRLKIPRLGIDAPIDSLGLTSDGDLDTPKTAENTGWYNAGPRPGSLGSAVIDGHFGYANDKPAVFDDLYTLVKGDVFYVEDDKKVTYSFIVNELRSFSPDDDATTVFRSTDNLSHLNLITCQGVWNQGQASYSNRLVVFADLISE